MSLWQRFFPGRGQGSRPVEKRTPLNLKLNDIVTYDMVDYLVAGILEYDDHGWRWRDYHLEGGGRRLWLSVEQDDELILGMYEVVPLPLTGDPPLPPAKLTYQGKELRREEAGEAVISMVEGQVGARVGNKVRYYDYCDQSEERFLSIENWDGDWEASYGWEIDPYELEFLAGS